MLIYLKDEHVNNLLCLSRMVFWLLLDCMGEELNFLQTFKSQALDEECMGELCSEQTQAELLLSLLLLVQPMGLFALLHLKPGLVSCLLLSKRVLEKNLHWPSHEDVPGAWITPELCLVCDLLSPPRVHRYPTHPSRAGSWADLGWLGAAQILPALLYWGRRAALELAVLPVGRAVSLAVRWE